jgi:hypothetical protein
MPTNPAHGSIIPGSFGWLLYIIGRQRRTQAFGDLLVVLAGTNADLT